MTNFTTKQKKCIELLSRGEMTQIQIAEYLKVAPQTISKWKHLKGFMEAVTERAREILKSNLPEIYNALTTKSKLGSDRHIKIYLDHLEKLEEIKAGRTSITFTWQAQQEGNNE